MPLEFAPALRNRDAAFQQRAAEKHKS